MADAKRSRALKIAAIAAKALPTPKFPTGRWSVIDADPPWQYETYEAWTLADRRLATIERKFYNRALEGDGDTTAAMVFVKTSERRAILAGANMPQSHVLQVVSQRQKP